MGLPGLTKNTMKEQAILTVRRGKIMIKLILNPVTGKLDQVQNIESPLQFKGAIAAASDFPTSAAVDTGWFYKITADVTDNDGTKTNTGQSFYNKDEIAWNGSDWTEIGPSAVLDLVDDDPFISMQNTTEEDSEGGRRSRIIFKGEQSGGEETTLAMIQASHDGTSDDQKGDLIFSINDGSDGDSPTERMRLDTNGLFITDLNDSINDIMINRNMSGFMAWTSGADASTYTITGGAFRIDRDGYGYTNGKRVDWTAPLTTGTLSTNVTSYIYIDSNGAIQKAEARTDALYIDNIVLYEVLYDGTNYVVVKDNHAFGRNIVISNYLHRAMGTVISLVPGADISTVGGGGNELKIQISSGPGLEDHGLEVDFSAVNPMTINHYHTNGAGKWIRDSQDSDFPLKYNSAGTPTGITSNRFGVFRVYASKDDIESSIPVFFSAMHTAQFTTIVQARTGIADGVVAATNELFDLEFAQLGYVIVKNDSGTPSVVEVQIEKSQMGGSIAGIAASDTAALTTVDVTNLDGFLSSADTNVQAALETLDNLRAGISIKDYEFLPIEWAINGSASPAAASLVTNSSGKTMVRDFASDATEDVVFNWEVPPDIDTTAGIKFWVVGVITDATGPSSEGVNFELSGYSVGDNDDIDGTFGTLQDSDISSGTYAQYDRFKSAKSSTITITNLAAEELAMLKFQRDHDDAGDDYGQDIGVSGIWIEYTKDITNQ